MVWSWEKTPPPGSYQLLVSNSRRRAAWEGENLVRRVAWLAAAPRAAGGPWLEAWRPLDLLGRQHHARPGCFLGALARPCPYICKRIPSEKHMLGFCRNLIQLHLDGLLGCAVALPDALTVEREAASRT